VAAGPHALALDFTNDVNDKDNAYDHNLSLHEAAFERINQGLFGGSGLQPREGRPSRGWHPWLTTAAPPGAEEAFIRQPTRLARRAYTVCSAGTGRPRSSTSPAAGAASMTRMDFQAPAMNRSKNARPSAMMYALAAAHAQ
jgi:hypothetical protein